MSVPNLICAAARRPNPRGGKAAHGCLGIPVIGRRWRRALGLVVLLTALAAPALAGGAIYTFTDDNGVIHFTNIPRGDPRYRRLPRPPQHASLVQVAPARYDYDPLIGQAAQAHRLPPALVKAVIAAESDFDPEAVSRAGAQGLMQLMPTTAAVLGVADPLEPTQNVHGGVSYLRSLLDRYGDLTRALAAYNAGPEAVDHYGGVPPYRETRAYVDRVLTYYRHYHGDFAR